MHDGQSLPRLCTVSPRNTKLESVCQRTRVLVLGVLDHYADCAGAVLGFLPHAFVLASACRPRREHGFHYAHHLLSYWTSRGPRTLLFFPTVSD